MRLRDGSGGVPFDVPASDDISGSETFIMHALATVVAFIAHLFGLLIEGESRSEGVVRAQQPAGWLATGHRSLKSLATWLGLIPMRPQRVPVPVRRVPAEWHVRSDHD